MDILKRYVKYSTPFSPKFLGNFIGFGDIFSFEFDGFVGVGLSAGAIKVFYQLEQLLGVSLSINVFYSFSPFISFVLCYAVSDLGIRDRSRGRGRGCGVGGGWGDFDRHNLASKDLQT